MTKSKAIPALKVAIKLWQWLAKNPGIRKPEWPGWKRYARYATTHCPLCAVAESCVDCPARGFWILTDVSATCLDIGSPYERWNWTKGTTSAGGMVTLLKRALRHWESK